VLSTNDAVFILAWATLHGFVGAWCRRHFGVRWEAQRHTALLPSASRAARITWRSLHSKITPVRKKRRRRFACRRSPKCWP